MEIKGINTGILFNAQPLSAEAIKNIEKAVLEGGKAFVYLDENSKLCFALPQEINSIKDLAWNHAYELSAEEGVFVKRAYKKNGLKTFFLEKTLKKQAIDGPWVDDPVNPTYGLLDADALDSFILE